MRSTHLASIALQAEKLRLQRKVSGVVRRVVMGVVGAVFAVVAIAFAHVAAYDALCLAVAPVWAALIVFGCDLVAAGVLFAIAAKGGVDPVADEAIRVRDDAWAQMKASFAVGAALRPVGRLLGRKQSYGLTAAALAARFLGRS